MSNITPKLIYNRLSKVYDECYKESIHKIENDFVFRYLLDNGFLEGMVLDVGSGTGIILENIDLLPENYFGLDISENMLEISKRKFPKHFFFKGNMSNMPFEDNSFDSVISLFGSFSYSLNHSKTVQEIERVLKPNGKFFIMIYGSKYSSRENYILNKFNITSPAKFFTHSEIKSMFSRFKCKKIFGITWISDYLSKLLSPKISKFIFNLEQKLFSYLFPNKFYFITITGQKNAKTL
jgi:ubiquinone/menaquinone biosynthesis C-methylase UbiE